MPFWLIGLGWAGLVWAGLVWHGLFWSVLVWSVLVWSGLGSAALVCPDRSCSRLGWAGLVWFGLVWSGQVWPAGVVWCGLACLVWPVKEFPSCQEWLRPERSSEGPRLRTSSGTGACPGERGWVCSIRTLSSLSSFKTLCMFPPTVWSPSKVWNV